MSIDLEQFHEVFFEESFEGLEIVEKALLEIDVNTVDDEIINTIFRSAHSIKGGSGTFGFDEVTEFTHLVETFLNEVREGDRKLTEKNVDLLLNSFDCIRTMVECLQAKQPIDESAALPLVAAFNELLGEASAEGLQENTEEKVEGSSDVILSGMIDSLVSNDGENPMAENLSQGSNMHTADWKIHFVPERQILLSGNEPARIFRELATLGTLQIEADCSNLPEFDQLVVDECYLSWTIVLNTGASEEEILEVFDWVLDECEVTVEKILEISSEPESAKTLAAADSSAQAEQLPPLEASVSAAEREDASVKPKKASAGSNSIRVGIDKVDSLINLVGELVITQSMLTELGSNFEMEKLDRLSNGLEQLLQNTKELQESVMRIRMLPISFAFNRFPRMIRDLANKTGKKVDLVLIGENTELDKTVMEQIGDPLVHLVRNAIDHGIEPSEERIARNKSENGTIRLDACHRGGNIVIEISDDGNGIDPKAIFKKATEKGIIKGTEPLSDSQIFDLIFEPGFSTAAVVSDISGRGVGMDVVRRNITALGGQIEIESELGSGSTFRIYLPLTLAILDGQLVRVGSETYVVPLVSIVESLQIKTEDINTIAGNMHLYRLRDDNVPIVPLYTVFAIEAENKELEGGLLVVVESGGQKMGILVDDLLAQQQVVVKSLETNYKRVPGVSGATILGDGSVSLILDIPGLLNSPENLGGPTAKRNRAA